MVYSQADERKHPETAPKIILRRFEKCRYFAISPFLENLLVGYRWNKGFRYARESPIN